MVLNMVTLGVSYREIDSLGRIVIPAGWRKTLPTSLMLVRYDDEIVIKPRVPGSFLKMKGKFPGKPGKIDFDEMKAAGAMDWQRE